MNHEPDIVQIARRTMERLRWEYAALDPYQQDEYRLAQAVLAQHDRDVLARWISEDRVLQMSMQVTEIEIMLARDPSLLVESLLAQARRSLMNKIEQRRSAGKIASAIQMSEGRPCG